MMPLDPRPAPQLPALLEVHQVAHRLGVGAEYVRRLLRDHELPAIRLGTRWRVDPLDLQAYIDKHRAQASNGSGHGD